MKKVLYLNFNVGSGIQYIGETFESWLKEIKDIELVSINDQTQSQYLIKQIIDIKPDVIIYNEEYPRSVDVCFYYKSFNPSTRLIGILHSWFRLSPLDTKYNNQDEELRKHFNFSFYNETIDKIFILNYRPESFKVAPHVEDKIHNYYFPIDPKAFRIKNEWNKRTKNFVYIGSFIYQKIDEKFLEIIKNYPDLEIDYYGSFSPESQTPEYIKKFHNSGIKIIRKLDQGEVCDVLNQYKYFILPHGAPEVFNITLLQSIMCGTIPLVSNDRTKNDYFEWIDWAKGCYFGCNTSLELLNNMKQVLKDNVDYTETSDIISKTINERVNYNEFKNLFQNLIERI